jgi:hypothetical protein
MNYWIFKCNPAKYDIDRRLLDPDPNVRWRVTSYRNDIRLGDYAFIWRTGVPRGIVALYKIDSDPFYMPYNPKDPEWTDEYKVMGRFVLRFPIIEAAYLKEIPGLEDLSVFHGYQAKTNFPVTIKEGELLTKIVYQIHTDLPAIPEITK